MSCSNCGTSAAGGCKTNGCSSGGCNKLNTYNWLAEIPTGSSYNHDDLFEISFRNGSRKAFFRNPYNIQFITGDTLVVEGSSSGFDIGKVSLSGVLVPMQMRKKGISMSSDTIRNILRFPTENDIYSWENARQKEQETMLMARIIARDLGLEMKIGDVEYQADGRKATFYYTASQRVDFRELIKVFAHDFRVKIEMRQIGARQEASRIGGIGSCGRELCCSTWLTDYKTVNTTAARYQNLSLNINKLSGQCGRLKCCLNYELDVYLDALKDFPQNAQTLATKKGSGILIKTDIFKRKMWYRYLDEPMLELSVEQVNTFLAQIKSGKLPESLINEQQMSETQADVSDDLAGQTSLESLHSLDKRNKRKRQKERRKSNRKDSPNNQSSETQSSSKTNNSQSSNSSKWKQENQSSNTNKEEDKNKQANKSPNKRRSNRYKGKNPSQNNNRNKPTSPPPPSEG
ncbi:MAG: hypothetical protein KDD49_04975 [Bacteroidetes bacterium]|nr:hypothetical protein [Bacteroidota bacterium]MCB9044352.1 hypothetical protein [Chitinophagales bacterium]